ncbi:YcxB family protein [Paraliobacillus zengyii]|uniref:YcxB family protein n=1 Tax=Paraliobacillus zengyii TaxID=2213194 RepID=UPI000DD3284C|nr:YcxB family protein [Paraliobacillus zengyii]
MNFHYTETFEDIWGMQKDLLMNSNMYGFRRKVFQWCIVFIWIILILLLLLTPIIPGRFIIALIMVVFTIYINRKAPVLFELIALASERFVLKKRITDNVQKEMEYVINDQEIKQVNHSLEAENTVKVPWEAVKRIREDEERYFIYYSKVDGVILPKTPNDRNPDSIGKLEKYIHNHRYMYTKY